MLLITDRDLLIMEPSVFISAGEIATRLASATDGVVAGTGLTSATSDFEASGVAANNVAVIAGTPVEVVNRIQATQLDISLPRAAADDDKIAPGDGSSLAIEVLTFERLIQQVQQSILLDFGVDPTDPVRPLDELSLLNPQAVGSLIALRTIHHAFAAAAARNPTDQSLAARASLYARLASSALRQTSCVFDLDGDGRPDTTRRLDVVTLVRI